MKYQSMSVLPINTLPAEAKIKSWGLPPGVEASRIAALRELSGYFHTRLENAFSEYDGDGLSAEGVPIVVRKFTVRDEPTDQTLVLEIAITEISPNVPEVSAVATVAGFFVPGSGIIRCTRTYDVRSMCFFFLQHILRIKIEHDSSVLLTG